MKCPFCGHDDTKVTDSRESDEGIRRRRECLNPACARRFTTYERVQVAPLAVVKRDGRREEFSRDKVLAGVRRSCAKLPVSAAQVDAIVDDIESALHARGVAEVPSSRVGDMVMERLRELNEVAYVRFAAHYRRFQEIDEFQRELAQARAAPRRPARGAGAAQPPLLPPGELSRLAGTAAQAAHGPSTRGDVPAPEDTPALPEPAAPVPIDERRARRRAAR